MRRARALAPPPATVLSAWERWNGDVIYLDRVNGGAVGIGLPGTIVHALLLVPPRTDLVELEYDHLDGVVARESLSRFATGGRIR